MHSAAGSPEFANDPKMLSSCDVAVISTTFAAKRSPIFCSTRTSKSGSGKLMPLLT